MLKLEEINEYLFYEFAYDVTFSKSDVSETWPFKFRYLETFQLDHEIIRIYEFSDEGDEYFFLDGPILTYYKKEQMTIKELYNQLVGSRWISSQDPVELNRSIIGDDSVPSVKERRNTLNLIAKDDSILVQQNYSSWKALSIYIG
ncbi:hypothetical protein [Paenibacillus sp. P36]|uniref:hypothetical protein n=1 Tax=Paenibacillus sp. P36 TaxID=3342538 RepID=UPI0038B3B7D0